MDECEHLREEIGRQIEKLRELNNTFLESSDSDQKTMDEWQDTIRRMHQTMKRTLIEAGKTYLLDQLHQCWTCTQNGKIESEYTAGIIFCDNKKCKNHFYYWSMCQALYGGLPGEMFKEAVQELVKEKEINNAIYH